MVNEIGNKHGRLLVVERVGSDQFKCALYKCLCDCGNETVVPGRALRAGNTISCGCAKFGRKWVKLPETCKRGHEFTEANTYMFRGARCCKTCKAQHKYPVDPIKMRQWRKDWRERNPDYHRKHWLQRAYGLTPEQYETMWGLQGGICPICIKPLARDKTTHVDHDHETGKVRELLHQTCNHGIGLFKDDPILMENAAAYVRKHKECNEASYIDDIVAAILY